MDFFIGAIFSLFSCIILMLLISFESMILEGSFFDTQVIQKKINVNLISEEYDSYRVYYLLYNQVRTINIPKNRVNISISKSYNNNLVLDYEILYSRFYKILEDENNKAHFYIPENYIITQGHLYNLEVNDIKEHHVIRKECINEMRYENGTYSFYVLDKYLNEYNFKEQNGIKVEFKKGDTKGYKACLNFDYYETLNHKLIEKKDHKPVYEIIISDDFDLTSLKR